MKDLIMKILLIGFVIFLGYTFIYGNTGTLESAANGIVGKANTTLQATDITHVKSTVAGKGVTTGS